MYKRQAVDVAAIPGTAGKLGRDEEVAVPVEDRIAQAEALLVSERPMWGGVGLGAGLGRLGGLLADRRPALDLARRFRLGVEPP